MEWFGNGEMKHNSVLVNEIKVKQIKKKVAEVK